MEAAIDAIGDDASLACIAAVMKEPSTGGGVHLLGGRGPFQPLTRGGDLDRRTPIRGEEYPRRPDEEEGTPSCFDEGGPHP